MDIANARDPESGFDEFWRAYPRRVAKADARKAWRQLAALRPVMPVLLAALDAAKRSDQWRRDEGRYIPYPATWLRGERWEDEHGVVVVAEADAKPWHATATGIERRGAELGLAPGAFAHWQNFRTAVLQAHELAERGSASGNVMALTRRRA